MTDEPKTKPFGKFRIPVNAVDRTAERSGTQFAIIGGIAPAQMTTEQELEAKLKALDPLDRALVEELMRAYPELTFEKALAMMKDAGGI